MKKKVIGCLLVVMCCVGIFSWHYKKADAKAENAKKTLKLNSTAIEKLNINVKGCDIKVMKTDKADPYCEYDNSICKVTMSSKNKTASIRLVGTSFQCFKMNERQIYKVYLPAKLKADQVEVKLDQAGAKIDHIPDGDVKIAGNESSMGLKEPENFNHKITIDLNKSSGSIGVQDNHLKQITFTEKCSSTDYPHECEKSIHKKNNRIKINVKNSSFDIEKKSDMSENGYCVKGGI